MLACVDTEVSEGHCTYMHMHNMQRRRLILHHARTSFKVVGAGAGRLGRSLSRMAKGCGPHLVSQAAGVVDFSVAP